MLLSYASYATGGMGKKHQNPWLKGEGWYGIVKLHTTTSPQDIFTLPLQRGIHAAHEPSSCTRRNGKKHQSPWLDREGWYGIVKFHTITSHQDMHTLPLQRGIHVAQLR